MPPGRIQPGVHRESFHGFCYHTSPKLYLGSYTSAMFHSSLARLSLCQKKKVLTVFVDNLSSQVQNYFIEAFIRNIRTTLRKHPAHDKKFLQSVGTISIKQMKKFGF